MLISKWAYTDEDCRNRDKKTIHRCLWSKTWVYITTS